jgi:hypothetical protein
MTTKQVLLSALILGATGTTAPYAPTGRKFKQMKAQHEATGVDFKTLRTAHEKNSEFEYPTLPTNQCDFCNFDSKSYQTQYEAAINRDVYTRSERGEFKNILMELDVLHHRGQGLAYNLDTIKQQKKLCPEYIAAKRDRNSEKFANLIGKLNHEQQ